MSCPGVQTSHNVTEITLFELIKTFTELPGHPLQTLRDLLAPHGFDPRRLRLEWIVPDDPHDFVKKVSDFTDLVKKL